MSQISLHWYLPTHGDGRTLAQASASTQSLNMDSSGRGASIEAAAKSVLAGVRQSSFDYMRQVAQTAELAGFDAVLTPTGTLCEDAWIAASSLIPVTKRLRFLVAFRPGTISPTLAAQQAATFQRFSGGRLLLNVVTGAESVEQRRFGDKLDKDDRYARTDEFLTIFRAAWSKPFDFQGEHLWVEGAYARGEGAPPDIYFGGSSDAALKVAARQADVYLSWGEPPGQLSTHFDRARALASEYGRALRYGVRMHVIARPDAKQAWAAAEALLADADPTAVEAVQATFKLAASEGQRRMTALLAGRRKDDLEVYPNVWAGVGLLRGGAGTALVGSYDQVADRIAEYQSNGVDEFILSGYPHVEEALWFSEGVTPLLRQRGLLPAEV
jgi:alkanesulfonate monooxygenase